MAEGQISVSIDRNKTQNTHRFMCNSAIKFCLLRKMFTVHFAVCFCLHVASGSATVLFISIKY